MRKILHRATFKTPIGSMTAIASETGLCALEFESEVRQQLLNSRLRRWFADYEMESAAASFRTPVSRWLDSYFEGEFPEPPMLDLRGSLFELNVWKALLEIPAAQTTTYGRLAELLGISGSARAVGTAVRRNPMSIIVPCHRVVGSDGKLRGYGGGLSQKEWLLHHEGARQTALISTRR